ncbi:MAG: DinB family protein [Dehalococcoidia bacterium]
MEPFEQLFRHNAWANARVLECLAGATHVHEVKAHNGQTIAEVMAHLGETEEAFRMVFRRAPDWPHPPSEVEAVRAYITEHDEGLIAFAAGLTAEEAAARVFVPWFETEVPIEQCLRQLLGHAAQHRAEAAWELARAGVDTGELDYIVWLLGQK